MGMVYPLRGINEFFIVPDSKNGCSNQDHCRNNKSCTGFIVSAVILVATAIFAIRNNEKFIDTTQWVNHTHEVLQEFDQILTRTVDAETGVRGYVVTGNEVFLDPYNNV